MQLINWMKKNYLIVILFIIVVLILTVKITIQIKDNKNSNLSKITPTVETKPENIINNLISPTPTVIYNITFGNKTREEILEMEEEDRYDFITKLSREEAEELDMMPNYDFSDFLPYISTNFIIEEFDYQNKKLTVRSIIDDKNKVKEEVNSWLFYSTGNNPRKIEIIWI